MSSTFDDVDSIDFDVVLVLQRYSLKVPPDYIYIYIYRETRSTNRVRLTGATKEQTRNENEETKTQELESENILKLMTCHSRR